MLLLRLKHSGVLFISSLLLSSVLLPKCRWAVCCQTKLMAKIFLSGGGAPKHFGAGETHLNRSMPCTYTDRLFPLDAHIQQPCRKAPGSCGALCEHICTAVCRASDDVSRSARCPRSQHRQIPTSAVHRLNAYYNRKYHAWVMHLSPFYTTDGISAYHVYDSLYKTCICYSLTKKY